jgi:hypothetical protein
MNLGVRWTVPGSNRTLPRLQIGYFDPECSALFKKPPNSTGSSSVLLPDDVLHHMVDDKIR